MSIGFPQNAPPWTLPYDNGASADWSANPATWVQVVGAGTVVVTNNDGANTSASFVCAGGEVITGCFSGLTSNSATRLRAGNGAPPTSMVATTTSINGASVPAAGALTTGNVPQVSGAAAITYAPVNLAGGDNYVTGVIPYKNRPVALTTAAAKTSAYAAVIGDMVKVDPTGGTFAVTLPALSATNSGQPIYAHNTTTSTTAVTFLPTGSDTINGLTSTSIAASKGSKGFLADFTGTDWIILF